MNANQIKREINRLGFRAEVIDNAWGGADYYLTGLHSDDIVASGWTNGNKRDALLSAYENALRLVGRLV